MSASALILSRPPAILWVLSHRARWESTSPPGRRNSPQQSKELYHRPLIRHGFAVPPSPWKGEGFAGDRKGRPYGITRAGSVGSSKPGAEVEPHQLQFLSRQGPVARREFRHPLKFCAPEISRLLQGVTPVMGSGESGPMDLGGAKRSRSPSAASPAILWFLSHRRERNSPPGRRNSPPQRSGSAGRLDAARRRGAYAPKGKRSRPLTPDPAVPGPPGPAWTVPHFCSACL